MKKILILLAAFIIYLSYGLFLSQYSLLIFPQELVSKNYPGFYDYAGVINIQSHLSTGSGSFADIIQSAQASGLDFIFITDLNVYSLSPNQVEGYHNNLLVFMDAKYSYLNARLLNLDATSNSDMQGLGRAQVFIADQLSRIQRDPRHGIYILSHPFRPRFQWSGDFPVGLDGLEVVNQKNIWEQAWLHSKISFLWTLLIYPFNDRLALIRLFEPPQKEINLWDQLTQQRHIIGIAGANAEARLSLTEDHYIKFPSYNTLFSLFRNHMLLRSELTGNFHSDRDKIVSALRAGQFYISLDMLADPKGFAAYMVSPQEEIFSMGSDVPWRPGLELRIHLPQRPEVPFDVIVFKDGQRVLISNSQNTQFVIHEPGVYRVEVRVIPTFPLPDGKKWIPWIYTNPFYVVTPD